MFTNGTWVCVRRLGTGAQKFWLRHSVICGRWIHYVKSQMAVVNGPKTWNVTGTGCFVTESSHLIPYQIFAVVRWWHRFICK